MTKKHRKVSELLEAIGDPASRQDVERALINPDIPADTLARWVTKFFGKITGQTIRNYREAVGA